MVRTLAVFSAVIALASCGGSSESSAKSEGAKDASAKVDRSNPCSLLLPSEITEIYGIPSTLREVVDEVTCHYHIEAPPDKVLKVNGESFIRVQVHWTDGKTMMLAQRLAGKLMSGGGDGSGFEQIPGVGDEAWLYPLASFVALSKGDVGVEIDLRFIPNQKEQAILLAKRIAGRI